MDVFIAILWYLQMLLTGTPYTSSQITQMVIENKQAVLNVMQDDQLLKNVIISFNDENYIGFEKGISVIEKDEEKDEDFEPMPFKSNGRYK